MTARILRIAGIVAMFPSPALGILALVTSNAASIVVGSWIVTPADATLGMAGAGIAAVATSGILSRSIRREHPVLRRVLVASACFVALVGTGIAALGSLSTTYRVLEPASDAGCRVAVREVSFLMAGSGDVGIIRPDSPIVEWRAEYVADDGGMPFTTGGSTITWQGETASVRLHSTPGQPAWWIAEPDLNCG